MKINDVEKQLINDDAPKIQKENNDQEVKKSKADKLVELISINASLFHNMDDEVFISFEVNSNDSSETHFENWKLGSQGFKNWASYQFYTHYETTPGDASIKDAADTLYGLGLYRGDEIEVYARYALHESKVYVDLGCPKWKAVEVSRKGYKVIESSNVPVKFVRSNTTREIPIPVKGGNISLIWKHLNIESEDSQFLCLAWILECMRINRPYPVLEITGEQGSAKSTFQKRLKEIIDPNKVDLRSAPRDVERIYFTTQHNHLISYNNLSHLTANTQDALCALSTGGGDASRKLYSDSEEKVLEAMRPVVINGITPLATRPDLGDRTIAVQLPRVVGYITESELNKNWEKNQPMIMGSLYELLSLVLAELPNIKRLDKPPRMADFAYLGQAMLNVQGIEKSFTEIFKRNRDRVVLRVIESSVVAQALINLISNEGDFYGTKGHLLERLTKYRPRYFDKASWPKSAQGLMNLLNRIAPALRVHKIEMFEEKNRRNDGFRVQVRKTITRN
ncbi:hypothetical protein [uncultured Cocleimonas sp.]|uniref:hypothetical protein n=1 Tax=uncultured Cocleimonas sp. TaxID=1051587 RepID=UPI00260702B2|nr:hypothetical protein [uncultured Cocleimonas sp.]